MKIFSWNVNGLRAVLSKGALQNFIEKYQPDILCLQETKAKQGQAEVDLPDYEEIWNSAERAGYSGTAIFTKVKPLSVRYGFFEEQDAIDGWRDAFGDARAEGRVLTAEYDNFYLVNVYTPNAKEGLLRIDYRMKWETDLRKYLMELDKEKPVIYCGDLNVAHNEIDLKNPKTNKGNAGFSDEERGKIEELLKNQLNAL